MCKPHKPCWALARITADQEKQSTVQIFPVVPQRTPGSASHPAPLQSACWSFSTPSPGAQQLPPEMSLSAHSELLPESGSHLPLLCLTPHLLVLIVKILLVCLESQALWFSSLLLRIHTANTWPELTSYLKGRKIANSYLFVVQACPMHLK